jgi:hypothetical protein
LNAVNERYLTLSNREPIYGPALKSREPIYGLRFLFVHFLYEN